MIERHPWMQVAIDLGEIEIAMGAAAHRLQVASDENKEADMDAAKQSLEQATDRYRATLQATIETFLRRLAEVALEEPVEELEVAPEAVEEREPDRELIRAQNMANLWGEPVLMCPAGEPGIEYTSRSPFVVIESMASAWAKQNATRVVQPEVRHVVAQETPAASVAAPAREQTAEA